LLEIIRFLCFFLRLWLFFLHFFNHLLSLGLLLLHLSQGTVQLLDDHEKVVVARLQLEVVVLRILELGLQLRQFLIKVIDCFLQFLQVFLVDRPSSTFEVLQVNISILGRHLVLENTQLLHCVVQDVEVEGVFTLRFQFVNILLEAVLPLVHFLNLVSHLLVFLLEHGDNLNLLMVLLDDVRYFALVLRHEQLLLLDFLAELVLHRLWGVGVQDQVSEDLLVLVVLLLVILEQVLFAF